jgi:hypothetical protein
MRAPLLLACLCGAFAIAAHGQEPYSFDTTQFEKKPFEIGGYAELLGEQFTLDPQAALYQLNYYTDPTRDAYQRTTGDVQIEALYRRGIASLHFLGYGAHSRDYTGSTDFTRVYEGYLSLAPSDRLTLDAGKRTLTWGKGYAWNPVGFIQRPKDPNDPELAREGYILASAGAVRSFDGSLKTVVFTPMLLLVKDNINDDFGETGHTNVAAKLYLLYHDTDIDLVALGGGSRSARYGLDFSRNLGTNFELHGEWAYLTSATRPVLNATGTVTPVREAAHSALVGLRYLTANDITAILEYYYNGSGYARDEMQTYFRFVHNAYAQYLATGSTALLQLASSVQDSYARPNAMRQYLYLRVSQKEPFDILYFTPALTAITNLEDGSASLVPELLYTGVTNLELRLRAYFLTGRRLSDFDEKPNDRKLELRVRYYF